MPPRENAPRRPGRPSSYLVFPLSLGGLPCPRGAGRTPVKKPQPAGRRAPRGGRLRRHGAGRQGAYPLGLYPVAIPNSRPRGSFYGEMTSKTGNFHRHGLRDFAEGGRYEFVNEFLLLRDLYPMPSFEGYVGKMSWEFAKLREPKFMDRRKSVLRTLFRSCRFQIQRGGRQRQKYRCRCYIC